MLLKRNRKLLLHGDGSPTRRYVYASDVADALDTIFHKGTIGQIYNIPSKYEVSNKGLSHKILQLFDISTEEPQTVTNWIEYTEDRPFNDQRYATDGQKLMKLGWQQKTDFDEGLRITIDWYRQFGEIWWGDITRLLTAFPVVEGNEIFTREEHESLELNTNSTDDENEKEMR